MVHACFKINGMSVAWCCDYRLQLRCGSFPSRREIVCKTACKDLAACVGPGQVGSLYEGAERSRDRRAA